MPYKNLGTPTGNNLYITIPLRGTQNWDEKLETGCFQKISDHDHTPGKGAAIREASLDNALQTKIAQIAINESEITQNALDISQNAANILANTQDISSNDTDIAALDTRLTTAESNITSNDTDIAALDTRLSTAESDITALETSGAGGSSIVQINSSSSNIETISNKDVIINMGAATTYISNKTFENCRIYVNNSAISNIVLTFTDCAFKRCDVNSRDGTVLGTTYSDSVELIFTDSSIESSNIVAKEISIESLSNTLGVFTSSFTTINHMTVSKIAFRDQCELNCNRTLTCTSTSFEYTKVSCKDLVVDATDVNSISFAEGADVKCDTFTHANTANATTTNRIDIDDRANIRIENGQIPVEIAKKLTYLISGSGNHTVVNTNSPLVIRRWQIVPVYGSSDVTFHNGGNNYNTGSALSGTLTPPFYAKLETGQTLTSSTGTQLVYPTVSLASPSGAYFSINGAPGLANINVSQVDLKLGYNVPAGLGANQYLNVTLEYKDGGGTIVKSDTHQLSSSSGELIVQELSPGQAKRFEIKFNNDVTNVDFNIKYLRLKFSK